MNDYVRALSVAAAAAAEAKRRLEMGIPIDEAPDGMSGEQAVQYVWDSWFHYIAYPKQYVTWSPDTDAAKR